MEEVLREDEVSLPENSSLRMAVRATLEEAFEQKVTSEVLEKTLREVSKELTGEDIFINVNMSHPKGPIAEAFYLKEGMKYVALEQIEIRNGQYLQ